MADLNDILVGLKESSTVNEYMYLQSLENRIVVFNEEVTENVVEKIITPLLNFESDDSAEPVTLYLQTVGGSVSDGLTLCSIIDNYKKPLKIIVLGYALSMGTIILCAGNKNPNVTKYCYPFSYALHHSGSMALFGESNVVHDNYDFMNKQEAKINAYIIANTGITEAELKDNSRRQWYLTAEEMKEKNLVDYIIGVDDVNE